MNTYKLELRRGCVITVETFTGSKLSLWIYMFKMRKWDIKILD